MIANHLPAVPGEALQPLHVLVELAGVPAMLVAVVLDNDPPLSGTPGHRDR